MALRWCDRGEGHVKLVCPKMWGKVPVPSRFWVELMSDEFVPVIKRVPDFGSQFCPIFGQEKDKCLTTTVRTFLSENNLKKL